MGFWNRWKRKARSNDQGQGELATPGSIAEAFQEVEELLDAEARGAALPGLKDMGDVEALIAALKDDRDATRWEAARFLGEIGDPRAVAAIGDALAAEKISPLSFITALKEIGDPSAVVHLQRFLDSDSAHGIDRMAARMGIEAMTESEDSDDETKEEQLLRAVKDSELELVRELLEAGANPSFSPFRGSETRQLLKIAVEQDDIEIVRALVEAGANVDIAGTIRTLLGEAVSKGSLELVKILLGAGADPNGAPPRVGSTALEVAARKGHAAIAKLLLDAGADPDYQKRPGQSWTPLIYAVQAGNADVVEVMLKAGANPKVVAVTGDRRQIRAATLAAEAGHSEISRMLEAGVEARPSPIASDLGESLEYFETP